MLLDPDSGNTWTNELSTGLVSSGNVLPERFGQIILTRLTWDTPKTFNKVILIGRMVICLATDANTHTWKKFSVNEFEFNTNTYTSKIPRNLKCIYSRTHGNNSWWGQPVQKSKHWHTHFDFLLLVLFFSCQKRSAEQLIDSWFLPLPALPKLLQKGPLHKKYVGTINFVLITSQSLLQSKFLSMFSCKQGHTNGSNMTNTIVWWNHFCNISDTEIKATQNNTFPT